MRFILTATLFMLLLGCGKSTSTKSSQQSRANEDPWQRALAAIRKDSDVNSCRRILLDLNSDLVKVPSAPQPSPMTAEELTTTTADYGWNNREAQEISTATYSALDAAYLAETIYLRDVAIALDVASLPPAQRANAAFQWVCRQVVLNEPKPNALPPMPATYVLRRGSGSGLERAYVFLELCRQLNIDAFLVGPPDAKGKPGRESGRLFWTVGTRTGTQIQLFDPWSGQVLPFNLEELRAASEKALAWAKPLELTTDVLKKTELFIALPLSAWATRWKPLEEKLEAERGLKLFAHRETLLKSAANAAKGTPVGFWNAGGDPYSLPRTLAYLLCELEGGLAPNHAGGISELAVFYRLSLIPGVLITVPEGIGFKEPRERIRSLTVDRYARSFLAPPMPRERFQRGQYQEASRLLVREWEQYTKMVERDRGQADRQKAIADWIERANRVYTDLNAADDLKRNAAQAAVNQFWKGEAKATETLTDQILGPVGMAESIYLLALCKQEEAERLTGHDPAKAARAWQDAHDWWKRYREFAEVQNRQYPGREAHAAALAARAERMVVADR